MLAVFPLGNDKTKGTDETPKYLAFGSTILNRRSDSTQNIWFLGISSRDHRMCGPKWGEKKAEPSLSLSRTLPVQIRVL